MCYEKYIEKPIILRGNYDFPLDIGTILVYYI